MRILNMFKYHLYPNIINVSLILFPNSKLTNRIRGKLLSPLFKKCGSNLQIASGVIINLHRNISIGNDVYIAHNAWINGTGGLIIEDEVIISPNVIITTTKHVRKNNKVSNYYSTNQKVIIGKGSWIAGNSTISMGVEVGSGCIVSANSLINKSKKGNNLLIGGVPATVIKTLGETDV